MIKRVLYALTLLFISAQLVQAGPYNEPIYNKATKSYFELYNPNVKTPGAKIAVYNYHYQYHWEQAAAIAARKIYHGVHGRLAVIKTAATHRFIAKHFVLGEPAWIGLRYWCTYHKLQWVTGEIHPLSAFQAWSSPWNVEGEARTGSRRSPGCEKGHKERFLPVHYWPTKQGFFWNANGYRKAFTSMFIEYPTGKP